MTRPPISSPAEVDHDARWRPDDPRGEVCAYRFRTVTCAKRGAHYCEPRASKVVAFFTELLVHTKGPLKRTAFAPLDWQEHEIIRPLFGEVIWTDEWHCYVRRYRVAHVVVSRKNGKSELAAGIQLCMLVGDDEESAECYSAAKDTGQAEKVFGPALRMRDLSPVLAKRLGHNKNEKRIFDERTASYYTVITADAEGELGHNPHCFGLDEVLSQPDSSLWTAMTTAVGARLQELMLSTTTETDKPVSFGADLIDEAERAALHPEQYPHTFAFVRKLPATEQALQELRQAFPHHPHLPVSIDPFDERNWKWSNPALDQFLSREALRRAAEEAKQDPMKLNGFLQFRMNRRVQQTTRWMPMLLWDQCKGEPWPAPDWRRTELAGRPAWCGLDLAAKFDLTSWCLLVPDPGAGMVDLLWRFWLPESALRYLDERNENRYTTWARQGWITVTDGDVLDYQQVYADIAADGATWPLVAGDADQWSMEPVVQEVERRVGLWEITTYNQTFARMTPGMTSLMGLVRQGRIRHHGNPVARACFENVEVRKAPWDPELIRPDKPDRQRSGVRIDAVPAAAMACAAWERQPLAPSTEPRRRRVIAS